MLKYHMWLAYSKSADGLEEAVIGHATKAAQDRHSLLAISSFSALPCMYLKMMDGSLFALCRPSWPNMR